MALQKRCRDLRSDWTVYPPARDGRLPFTVHVNPNTAGRQNLFHPDRYGPLWNGVDIPFGRCNGVDHSGTEVEVNDPSRELCILLGADLFIDARWLIESDVPVDPYASHAQVDATLRSDDLPN